MPIPRLTARRGRRDTSARNRRNCPMSNRASVTRRSLLRTAAAAGVASLAAPYVLTASKVFAADPAADPAADAEGYLPLFDGKTLNGWHKNPEKIGHGTGGTWVVKDGA